MSTPTTIPDTPPAAAPSPPKRYSEAQVAKALGLSRNVIKQLRQRHLDPETDCLRKGKGGSFQLTQSGYEKIIRQVDQERASAAVAEVETLAAAPQKIEVTVIRTVRNPHLLVCARIDSPEIPDTLVRVRSNEHFMPGMRMEVSPSGTMWQYTGRLPKRRGKW